MKLSSATLLIVFCGLGTQVFAEQDQATAQVNSAPVETYHYQMKLDVHRVIAVTQATDECKAAPVQMTYEDSQGQRHILEYQVLGTGCSNG